MSGPKLSAAELERRRQEQLERERQEALRRLKEAQDAYRKACQRADRLKQSVADMLARLDPVLRSQAAGKADKILAGLQIPSVTNSKSDTAYNLAASAINASVDQCDRNLKQVLGQAADRSAGLKKSSGRNASHQAFQSYLDINDGDIKPCDLDFTCKYDADILKQQFDQLRRHLKDLADSGIPDLAKLASAADRRLRQLASQGDLWSQHQKVKACMQSIVNEEEEILRRYRKMASLYSDYAALAAMTDTDPKDPGDFADQAALEAEIARLSQVFRKKDEMDFIADMINDAMVDLGYSFVTSRVMQRKDSSEADVSIYQADDRTGVAVYTDQSGAVMMRITVLGEGDITDDDCDFSYQRQLDFCAAHPDLVAALEERGVLLQQKNYCAPDRQYTYKMNLNAIMQADADTDTAADTVTGTTAGTTAGQGTDADQKSGQSPDGKTQTGRSVQKINRRKRRRASTKKVRHM